MTEKMYVASSEDYGRDEQSAMVGTGYSFHVRKCCCALLATMVFLYHFFFCPRCYIYA